MSGLDIFALIVLLVLLCTGLAVFVVLGMLPGRVALARHHPYAEAINIGSWLALLAGGLPWILVLVWAAVALTAISGANYAWKARPILQA